MEVFDVCDNRDYPSSLFAAVKSGNELAVQALLENGADPTVKFRGRYIYMYIYMQ